MSLFKSDPLAPTSNRALVVMARLPRPGRCKTRLTPPLTRDEAAGLYRAFLCDIGRLLSEWGGGPDVFVAWADDPGANEELTSLEFDEAIEDRSTQTITDHSPPTELRAIFSPETRFLRQHGQTLTERMDSIFDRLFSAGYGQVVMRNSDSPHLPTRIIDDAFAQLSQSPAGTVVLGPDLGGGYYLVGLDGPPAGLFPEIMSTSSVLDQTVSAAAEHGREVRLTESFIDIDSIDDLRLFWLEFGGRSDVRHWATWRRLAEADIMNLSE